MKRTVVSEYWADSKIEQLSSAARFVLLYLLTSPLTTLSGCYEVSYKRIATDTGLNIGQVKSAISLLSKSTIIEYSESTSEVLIRNWSRYNWNKSPKLNKPLASSIESVKEPRFKQYLADLYENTRSIPYPYSIDTLSIPSISIYTTNTNSKEGVKGEDEPPESPKPSKPSKHAHGELGNVFLTDAEVEKLKAKFPSDWKERIDNLGYYIGSKGDHYTSHYLTILNWARKNDSPVTRREVKANAKYANLR